MAISLRAAVLLVVLAGIALARPAPFKGVLVTAQYRCDDFLCPDWELDVARVNPAYREPIITKLAMLVPKSPVIEMSFPVFTAFHEASRTFYTVGLPVSIEIQRAVFFEYDVAKFFPSLFFYFSWFIYLFFFFFFFFGEKI